MNLNQLVAGDILWVDKADALNQATCHIEECKVIGLDCEWKPNYIKGNKPNKVITDKFLLLMSAFLLQFLSCILVYVPPVVFSFLFFFLSYKNSEIVHLLFAPLD